MKTKIILTVLSTLLATFALTAQAKVLFQAGDIAEGKKWPISDTSGIASYFKSGKSGDVTFTCEFEGNGVKALVFGGKNFLDNKPLYMQTGLNGPYTWTLHSRGDAEGSIRVELLRGENVNVQCKEI